MTAKIKLGFVVEADQLGAALRAMSGIALGMATIMDYYPDFAAEQQLELLEVAEDQTPEAGQPFNADPPPPRNGPARPASLLMKALEVLRDAGGRGIASSNFHDAMIAHGLDRKASHNALFNVKKLGLARQGANKRIYITREGNTRASS